MVVSRSVWKIQTAFSGSRVGEANRHKIHDSLAERSQSAAEASAASRRPLPTISLIEYLDLRRALPEPRARRRAR
jgi:hypothetical protein